MTAGILALQGAFAEHGKALDQLGISHFEIRKPADLEFNPPIDALILPGGESTVMGKLLRESGLSELILNKLRAGMPAFGTCAGLILLAKEVENSEGGAVSAGALGTMDIRVRRNAYGRQLGSFHTEEGFLGIGKVPMTFIRAPYIEKAYEDVEILARVNGKIVAARQKNQLVCAFHPELTKDLRVHRYFFENCL